MVASSFTSVSLDPPLVSICVNRTSTTWPILRRASRLGVSVLAEDHGQVARALAGRSGDRFDKMQWEAMPSDAVLVHGSTLWLECRLERTMTAGDHDIVLLEVHGLRTDPDVSPLVFHGSSFRRLGPTA
jgi:flavin reductase (DIM6/NTAB) family NADH-FMN oxidoreductase RutF